MADDTASSEPVSAAPRQHVERVTGARRARLTPVEGSDPDPESAVPIVAPKTSRPRGPKGPNDDRMLEDVPPHY